MLCTVGDVQASVSVREIPRPSTTLAKILMHPLIFELFECFLGNALAHFSQPQAIRQFPISFSALDEGRVTGFCTPSVPCRTPSRA